MDEPQPLEPVQHEVWMTEPGVLTEKAKESVENGQFKMVFRVLAMDKTTSYFYCKSYPKKVSQLSSLLYLGEMRLDGMNFGNCGRDAKINTPSRKPQHEPWVDRELFESTWEKISGVHTRSLTF